MNRICRFCIVLTAGNAFAIEGSVPAAPNTKLIAEDRIQTAAGTVSAGATLGAPDNWGVAFAAFKAGTAGGGSPPSITSLNPTSGAVGTSVTIADNVATRAEYLVYAPNGGSITVNLSATTRTLNVEWLNPTSGAITTGGTIAGGSANQSFTPAFSGDAVLYLVDVAGHN